MKEIIASRLAALRAVMRRERLCAFIFPSTDPHQGEYVADHWKGREFISGFNGSAGTAVVTLTGAALWTDSRYFIAAAEQLSGTEFQLMRLKMKDTPTVAQWIGSEVKRADVPGFTDAAIDGMVWSMADTRYLIAELRREGGITLRTNLDPLREIWPERPAIPMGEATVQPLAYAGEKACDKLARIRRALVRHHADGMLMAALDDIAWTTNLRGTDVHCCPLVVSYLLISREKATLFVDEQKTTPEVRRHLLDNGIDTAPYEAVDDALRRYPDYNILLDPAEVSHSLRQAVKCEVVEAPSPVPAMKIVKNEAERAGFHQAMLRDGVAMVRLLKWIDEKVADGTIAQESELSVAAKAEELRSQQKGYRGPSFDTIAGYAAHGAIVHYEPTEESNWKLENRGLLLLDSGGQYDCGTTDITRTIPLGFISEEERHVYTLVLKGHIQISMAKFPEGISGTQLDVLAKQAMWREGLTYLHGTGHGVGSYLNVHEGPHQIRMEWKPQPLMAGMTVTDEPGIYLENRFGVRIENTLAMVPYMESEFGPFLQFEPLTLCPIDLRPIDVAMLSHEELSWLNSYHAAVREALTPLLQAEEAEWLKRVSTF